MIYLGTPALPAHRPFRDAALLRQRRLDQAVRAAYNYAYPPPFNREYMKLHVTEGRIPSCITHNLAHFWETIQ